MRNELKSLYGQNFRWMGTVSKLSVSINTHRKLTIMLFDVRIVNKEKVIVPHLWISVSRKSWEGKIQKDQVISFDASIVKYKKRIQNRRRSNRVKYTPSTTEKMDYGLDKIRNLKIERGI